jgi:hypothetical protein
MRQFAPVYSLADLLVMLDCRGHSFANAEVRVDRNNVSVHSPHQAALDAKRAL